MQEAVVVNIALSEDGFGTAEDDILVEALDARIRAALQGAAAVGHWDGHEFGGGWARVFCYGPSADALFEVLASILLGDGFPAGSYAVKCFGSSGAQQQIIQLSGGAA